MRYDQPDFAVGHLPRCRHSGILNAFLDYGEKSVVIGRAFQSWLGQICALASGPLNAVARGALRFKKLFPATEIFGCELRWFYRLNRRGLPLYGQSTPYAKETDRTPHRLVASV